MQKRILISNIHEACRKHGGLDKRRQLLGARSVRAFRDADEEMTLRFADIPAIKRSGRLNFIKRGKECLQCLTHLCYFAKAARSPGPSQHRAFTSNDCSILDKS